MKNVELLSPEKHLELAQNFLEKKELVEFITNIGYAMLNANEEMLAKVYFLKARGLFLLRQYDEATKAIDEALKYNTGREEIKLKKYKGLILGDTGYLEEAIAYFKNIINDFINSDFIDEKVGLLINLSWAQLMFSRTNKNSHYLKQAYTTIQEAYKYFDIVESDRLRKYILMNHSEYCNLMQMYDEAIALQEKVFQYCKEEELPEVYNNLAELSILSDRDLKVDTYLEKVEIIAEKYKNYLELGKCYYNHALLDLRYENYAQAIDSLYMAIDYFISAKAITYAFEAFNKLGEISREINNICLDSLNKAFKGLFVNTAFTVEI